MTTTVEAVNQHLASDPALVDALARGLVNLRQTARWMIKEHDWDTTEDAVVSAMRRYKSKHPQAGLSSARDLLQEALLDVLSGLALISLPRTQELHERLPGLWKITDGTDTVGALPARTQTRLLVEKTRLPALREALGPHRLRDVVAPVSALRLRLPEARHHLTAAALVLSALTHRNLEVLEIVSACRECLLVVPYEEVTRAYEAASALIPA